MAGGLSLPRPISRETIRREGSRLGYTGDALADFTEIIVQIDDFYVEVAIKAEAQRARVAAQQVRRR